MSDTGTLVLASGGVESAVLLHHVADGGGPVQPVYVRQGFRWERVEALWLERFLAATARPEILPLEVLAVPLADLYSTHHFARDGTVPAAGTPDEDCYLPGRNVMLLAKAGVLAAARDYQTIALGSLSSNPFPDASPSFFNRMAAALTEGLAHPLSIITPLAHHTKPEVVRLGQGLPFELTLSCMAPSGELHCGRCSKCDERKKGFADAGLPDPTEYAD